MFLCIMPSANFSPIDFNMKLKEKFTRTVASKGK